MVNFKKHNGSAETPGTRLEPDSGNGEFRRGITKTQLSEIQERFRKQREEYEHQNKVFVADERKKALYR